MDNDILLYEDEHGQYTNETILQGIQNHTIINTCSGSGLLNLLSVNGLSFLLMCEGWTGVAGDSIANAHSTATAKQQSIDRSGVVTVGPGCTNYIDKTIVAGKQFTFEEVVNIFANAISAICDTIEKVCPEIKSAGQAAIDMVISYCYNAGNKQWHFKNCSSAEQVANVLRGGVATGGKVSLSGRRSDEAAIADGSAADTQMGKTKFYYEVCELAEEIMQLKGTYTDVNAYNSLYGGFSGNVTNPRMKKVLEDCSYYIDMKGVRHMLTHESHHQCTCGPATWYGRAGLRLTFWNGKGPAGAMHEDVHKCLGAVGFKMVWHGTGAEANQILPSQLRPGDIACMHSATSGHACMWTGSDWRSDFIQNRCYVYNSAGRDGNYSCHIWRHPDFQEPGLTV